MNLDPRQHPRFGVSHLDEAHAEIHRRSLLVIATVSAGARAAAVAQLEELLERVALHFQDEERWMQAVGYPELAAHVRAHALGVQDLRRALTGFAPDGADAERVEAVARAVTWLDRHLEDDDVVLGRFLDAQRPPPPALPRGG
jgi:hemerythrin